MSPDASSPHTVDPPAPRQAGRRGLILFLLGCIAFSAIVFLPAARPGQVLVATDDSIGEVMVKDGLVPGAFRGGWRDDIFVGTPVDWSLNLTRILLWILPPVIYKNWIYAILATLSSVFLTLFLRGRGVGWAGCVLGSLTAFWLGSNFTLLFAGHTAKFGVLMFAALFLWVFDAAVRRRSAALAVIAGGAFGAMFLEQADVAMFFAVLLGPYALFAVWSVPGLDLKRGLVLLVPMFGVALLLAFHPLWSGYKLFVEDVSVVDSDDGEAKWDYATQWSWPPSETIDFIAPGYMGWRSNEPDGPYWGIMGRTPGWEDTGSGFRNFKLESPYLGAVPVALAVWVVFAGWWARRLDPSRSREILCWAVLTGVAFLLACGKFLPVYRVFFLLPVVSSVRNPNKFLQIFQIGVGILAAFGLDALLAKDPAGSGSRRARYAVAAGFGAFSAILLLWWLASAGAVGEFAERMKGEGWGQLSETIARNRLRAMMHGALLAVLVSVILALRIVRPRWLSGRAAAGLGWLLTTGVAVDGVMLSRQYVEGMDLDPIRENPVAKYISGQAEHHRTFLASQGGVYNLWLTYVLPYHGITTFNVTAAPRLKADYQAFIEQAGRDSLRMWQLCGIRYVLGPAELWAQIQASPAKDRFRILYAYNLEPGPDLVPEAVPAGPDNPGRHCVLAFAGPAPRYALVDRWEEVPDEEVLARLTSPGFVPYQRVLVAPGQDVPASPDGDGQGIVGTVTVKSYRSGEVVLQVSNETPAVLRVAEKYEPGWVAEINGDPTPVFRCDDLFQGVYVPAGLHQVTLTYRRRSAVFWVQVAGLALCLGAGIAVARNAWRARTDAGAQDA